MSGVDHYEDFYAICNHEPLGPNEIRVGGVVVFRQTEWKARLELHKGPGGINYKLLQLELVITPPPPGAAVIDVLTRFELPEWRQPDPVIEYDEVDFRVVGSVEEPEPPTTSVDHVS